MYEDAKNNEQVVNIHLFGIKYGDIIKKNGFPVSKIVEKAGMRKSYNVEVSKGIKLSKFVSVNP